jgi:hypothetical protein
MMQALTIAIWGAAVVGYVAMLLLTERSAGRFVRGETRAPSGSRTFIVAAGAHDARSAAEGLARTSVNTEAA